MAPRTVRPEALSLIGKALCLSEPLGSPAASGAGLADVWTESKTPVVDSPGDEFLDYVKDGMCISVGTDGLVSVE